MQHRGDVVGIGEPARPNEPRQQCLGVVMVGLRAAQLRGERTERLGLDRGVRLVGCQARGLDQGGPAVSLGGGSNRLVLRGELGDRPPLLLFGSDGLVRGQLGTDVLEHPEQHGPAGGVGVVARMRFGVLVGPVEDHVGAVGVLAAGHRDVKVLPRRGRLHQHVRGIDGDALCPVGGDRVTKINMVGHVGGGEDDGAPVPTPGGTDGD